MEVKKFLNTLFFVSLIALKVSAAPIYLHDCHNDGHIDDCELCSHAINNQNTAFSIPPQFETLEVNYLPTSYRHQSHYESIYIAIPIVNLYHGRPPPRQ